jgi:hypothetical protein
MKSISPPPCVCQSANHWQVLDVNTLGQAMISYWQCALCLRPGHYIEHDAGNAFVIPRACVEEMPNEVLEYIAKVLGQFTINGARLHTLQLDYEWQRYRCICNNLDLDPEIRWASLMETMQFAHDVLVACIYLEPGWQEPAGFNPAPVPHRTEHALVYVLAPLTRGSISALCWHQLPYSEIS